MMSADDNVDDGETIENGISTLHVGILNSLFGGSIIIYLFIYYHHRNN